MSDAILLILPLLIGWLLDLLFGDPQWLPHPVVGFGKMIAFGERHLNKGNHRKLKGAMMSLFLIGLTFAVIWFICSLLPSYFILLTSILIFFCLAGTTLIREVREVFRAVDDRINLFIDNESSSAEVIRIETECYRNSTIG